MTVHKFTNAAAGNYKVVCKGDSGELYLYGQIGQDWFGDGISAKAFADEMRKLSNVKTLHVRVNSEGGDVFTGKAMYSLLQQHKARVVVHIDGLAASAASFIAMAGDEIQISEGGFLMIHDAYGHSMGRAADHRAFADLLDVTNQTLVDTYAARTKQDPDKIKKWMQDETWMTGKEAVANGFADKIVENLKVAAKVADPSKFKNLPAALRPNRAKALSIMERKSV